MGTPNPKDMTAEERITLKPELWLHPDHPVGPPPPKRRNWLKRFFCWMRWHSFGYETTGFDGCSTHARCKWCGYEGMIDSQGNLF